MPEIMEFEDSECVFHILYLRLPGLVSFFLSPAHYDMQSILVIFSVSKFVFGKPHKSGCQLIQVCD